MVSNITTRFDPIWYNQIAQISGLVLTPFGTLMSLICACVLSKETFVKRNAFFGAMFVIAVLDFAACLNNLFLCLFYRTVFRYGTGSYTFAVFTVFVRGFCVSVAFGSDLFTLAITAERYLALCHPHSHRNMSARLVRNLRILVSVLVAGLSLLRFTFSLELAVVDRPINGTDTEHWYWLGQSWLASQTYFVVLETFSSLVAPFVLMLLMSCLSLKIVCRVLGRRQKTHRSRLNNKSAVSPVTQQTTALADLSWTPRVEPDDDGLMFERRRRGDDQRTSFISLTMILDLLFLLNQAGLSVNMLASYSPEICRTVGVGVGGGGFCSFSEFVPLLSLISATTNYVCRSINLILYLLFSSRFRAEAGLMCNSIWVFLNKRWRLIGYRVRMFFVLLTNRSQ